MSDLPDWAPSPSQVAARIMARTRDAFGNIGAFTEETTPTVKEVQEQIELAVALMAPRLGEIFNPGQAQSLAALRTAWMIELAYFPEQSETMTSPYKALKSEYEAELCNWDKAAEGLVPNDAGRLHTLHVGTEYPGYATGTF